MKDDESAIIAAFFQALGSDPPPSDPAGAVSIPEVSAGTDSVRDALAYLRSVTAGILRNDGAPHYVHPLRVACILAENRLDRPTIIASLLHGLPSLSVWDEAAVKSAFGDDVVKLINSESRLTGFGITKGLQNKTAYKAEALQKMLFALADDVRVIILKLAERLDTIRHGEIYSASEQRIIGTEAIDIWAPLANRLGMSAFKSEFEDLALKYTNSDAFQQAKKLVGLKKAEREDYLLRAQKEVYRITSRAGVEVAVSARAKHLYSVYQKMRKRAKEADEIFDLLALRIIVNTRAGTPPSASKSAEAAADCYTVLGLVHSNWKPLDGRFKDYIAMPKANGYQSLHTTVLFEGKALEIQIRTEKMHSVAEHGVASHYLYKQETTGGGARENSAEQSIIKKLKALTSDTKAGDTSYDEIRAELLGDSIFVFTPKGDIKELPRGATAIDFAYEIHSAVGEKIVAAKADGRIIPLSSPLKNTQIVEIITNPQAHPTVNQLASVKTARARAKIRSWIASHTASLTDSSSLKGGSSNTGSRGFSFGPPKSPPRTGSEKGRRISDSPSRGGKGLYVQGGSEPLRRGGERAFTARGGKSPPRSSPASGSFATPSSGILQKAAKAASRPPNPKTCGKAPPPLQSTRGRFPPPPLRDPAQTDPKGFLPKPRKEIPCAPGTGTTEGESKKISIGSNNNFMISFAKCCDPLPGDEIVAYVSRGRGLIIHRRQCSSLERTPGAAERTLEAHWT